MPYQVKRDGDDGVITKIADLVNDKVIPEISDVNNHSDRTGTRITIELKRDAIPKVVLNKLYKHTAAADRRSASTWSRWWTACRARSRCRRCSSTTSTTRSEVVTRRTKFDLDRAEKRAHILEGYLIALDHLDEVIELIRAAPDAETARAALMDRFEFSEAQAHAILELRLRALTGLERKRIKDEHDDLLERIAELRAILADEAKLLGVIKEELMEIRDRFARRPAHRDHRRPRARSTSSS